jgi:hypothetical protein
MAMFQAIYLFKNRFYFYILKIQSIVTKKKGYIISSSIQTAFNEPRRPCSPNLLHTYRPPIFLTLELPVDSFFCTLQIENIQTQQHSRPHSIHLLPHPFTQMPSKETLSLHCRLCTFPESTSIVFHQKFTKHQIRCCSVSFSLSLSDSSTAVATLITRRSRKFWLSV